MMREDEIRKYLTEVPLDELLGEALEVKKKVFGEDIYIRGLIEVSNYCTQDCYYCGIRASSHAERYRLSDEDIYSAAREGYEAGFSTFVMQGGEDPAFTDDRLVRLISTLKEKYPDVAITLSLGERSYESYKKLFDAGADRFLLRHETINEEHFSKLHPPYQELKTRVEALENLKDIGYQTGCGVMVGSPYQTLDNLIEDLLFIQEFKPHMVGIGPFIPHKDTPFKDFPPGDLERTLRMVAITRLLLPEVLLPATTALATLDPKGRELGLQAGANVIMPNLSPIESRKKYTLYDGKAITGGEAYESLVQLKEELKTLGHRIVTSRGDHPEKG